MRPNHPPQMLSGDERIALAAHCRDCDDVPKVPDAGQIITHADGSLVQIMHNGLRVAANGYYGGIIAEIIKLCRGHHEGQEERIFHEVVSGLGSDATMIELGAHWAYYSLWFLQGGAGRRAVALEPEPRFLEVGKRNAQLNDLSPLFVPGFVGGTFEEHVAFQTEESGEILLTRHTVQSLMDKGDMEFLSLLHCDTQGAEVAVLESCRLLFRQRRIGWVFVSTHAHQISGDPLTHEKCLAILREEGAVIEAEHDVHESFSGDGLIVARFVAAPSGWKPLGLSHCRHSKSLFRSLSYDLAEARAEIARLSATRGVI